MNRESPFETTADERAARIRQVVMDCLQRRNQGETVTDQSLIQVHTDLMPELGEDLALLRLFESAQQEGEDHAEDEAVLDNKESSFRPRGLHIRCPHCHQPVEILVDSSFTEITCSDCGSHFSLIGDDISIDDAKSIKTLGHLQLIERLGVGGFGAVWKAHDMQLDRTVAVKLPRVGQLGAEETEQFLREARAAAQLQHPNIVSVHEVGRHNDRVYIVSDYIQGFTLADWFRQQQPTPREAAELCAKLADAMHHAHEAGVIHRDLKPANVILDGQGEPHVTDFGLAKRDAGEVTMTVEGKLLGTPAYMSPEQAVGAAHQADRRADIYSLGAILFELLTGELPFRGNSRMLIQQVIHDEPPSPRKLNGRIPRDLETICLKCLEKDPGRRYASAQQLAEELRRYLQSKPIQARRTPAPVRGWRWCKRNPMAATVLALLLLLAISGSIVAMREASLRSSAENARNETHSNLYVGDMRLGHHAWDMGNIQLLDQLVQRHGRPGPSQRDLRGFEYYYLSQRLQDVRNTPTLHLRNAVADVAYSTDAATLAIASGSEIHIWNVHTHLRQRVLNGQGERVTSLAFSPDNSSLLASASANRILLWDTRDGGAPKPLGNHAGDITAGDALPPSCLAFSPDGNTLACGVGTTIVLWNVGDGREVARLELNAPRATHASSMAFSPDGRVLATANLKASVSIFDPHAKREIVPPLLPETGHNNTVAFSPDGRILASGGNEALIRFWDTATWEEIAIFPAHSAPILSMAFSPDGTLVTGGQEGTIKLWDTNRKMVSTKLRGHRSGVSSVSLSPNGNMLASGSSDGTVMLWDVGRERGRDIFVANTGLVNVVDFSPDDKKLISASPLDKLRLWDVASRSLLKSKQFDRDLWSVAYAPDGKTLALGTEAGLLLWDVTSWQEVDFLPQQERRQQKHVMSVRFSPDGNLVAAGNWAEYGGTVVVWDLTARHVLAIIEGFDSWYGGLAFSPDGTTLAVPKSDFSVLLWNADSRKDAAVLEGHSKKVRSVAFSVDGQTIATASEDMIFLWDVATRKIRTKLAPDQAVLEWVAFSPDEKTLASSGRDGTIKLWSFELTQEVGTLRGHVGPVGGIAFSEDGRLLASGGWDKTIRLWRAAAAEEPLMPSVEP